MNSRFCFYLLLTHASGGVGNDIVSYEIQYSDSSDNIDWSSWTELTIFSTTDTYGSLSVSPPSIRGNYRRFRVRTRGSIGENGYSDWTISDNSVRRKRIVPSPTVDAPKNESITYNINPYMLITTGNEQDEKLQVIEVKIDDSE